MAEWLKALVLKVVDEPTNPVNTGVPLMFDISVLLFGGQFGWQKGREKAAIRFAKNRMAGVSAKGISDGKAM